MVAKCRFLALVAFVALCTAVPVHAQRIRRQLLRELPADIPQYELPADCTHLRDIYGYDNVRLVSLDKVSREKVTAERELPGDLAAILKCKLLDERLQSSDVFAKTVLATAQERFGYSPDQIAQLSPPEAVKLAAEVANALMVYTRKYVFNVDRTPDQILTDGEGDCKHYSRLTAAVFRVFKGRSAFLKNTYVLEWPCFLSTVDHCFNTCVLVREKSIEVFYVDALAEPTFHASAWYVRKGIWRPLFFLEIDDVDEFRKEFQRIRRRLSKDDHSLLIYQLVFRLEGRKRYAEAIMLLDEVCHHANWRELKVSAYAHLAECFEKLGNTRESRIYQFLVQQADMDGVNTDLLVRNLKRYVWSID